LSAINEIPERAVSSLLQEELRNLEQKNSGRFEATAGAHDDAIMAYNFCLYVRREMIQDGTIVAEGRVAGKDPKRINYYLDVTMSTAEPRIIANKEGIEFQQINNDYKEEKKRIPKELQVKEDDFSPLLENAVIIM